MVVRAPAHTLFFDRSIGRRIPEALRSVGIPVGVKYHDEHFSQDAKDDEWLPEVGMQGWAVIGQDKRYHRNATERLAIVRYNVECSISGRAGHCLGPDAVFHAGLRRHLEVLNSVASPFLYRIYRSGRLHDITRRLR